MRRLCKHSLMGSPTRKMRFRAVQWILLGCWKRLRDSHLLYRIDSTIPSGDWPCATWQTANHRDYLNYIGAQQPSMNPMIPSKRSITDYLLIPANGRNCLNAF